MHLSELVILKAALITHIQSYLINRAFLTLTMLSRLPQARYRSCPAIPWCLGGTSCSTHIKELVFELSGPACRASFPTPRFFLVLDIVLTLTLHLGLLLTFAVGWRLTGYHRLQIGPLLLGLGLIVLYRTASLLGFSVQAALMLLSTLH